MTASHRRTRRLAALVLAMTALAALLPVGASAASPALSIRAEPEHAYALIRGVGGPEGIVLLEERPSGLFVGIGMTGVGYRVVSLYGATAPCGLVGFSTVRLGTFHPVDGRFAAGYISGAADAVDTIASVRLMAGNELLACRTLTWGDADGISCDTDPEQPDCPRPEYVAPGVGEWFKLLRAGMIPLAYERPDGKIVAAMLGIGKLAYRFAFGDASCADGGGKKLGEIVGTTDHGGGVTMRRVSATLTLSPVRSIWLSTPTGATTCVNVGLLQVIRAG